MQLTELEARWADLDRRLDGVALEVQSWVDAFAATKSTTQRLLRQVAIGVFVNGAIALALGLFSARHFGQWQFVLPALAIDVCAIALLIRGIHQWILLKRTDLGTSVVDAQRRIEQLRQSRIQTNKWTLILAPLMWMPMLIVTLKALFGVDSFATFPLTWFVVNVGVGIGFIAFMYWLSRRFGDRFHDASFVKRSLDTFAGRTLARSTTFLDQLRKFELDR